MRISRLAHAPLARTLGVVLALSLSPLPLLAQTDEQRADARAAASEGADAYDAGKYRESLDLFTRAESLVHAPPHVLYIARSHQKLGQLVKAREMYRKLAAEQLPAGAPRAFVDAQAEARAALTDIEPRLAALKISVTGAGDQPVKVTMDGVEVPSAVLGVSRPTDPGKHELMAVTVGKASEKKSIELKEGEKQVIELVLVAGAPGSLSAPAAATAAAPATAPATSTSAASTTVRPSGGDQPGDQPGSKTTLRIFSYASLGLGVLGMGFGTMFALKSGSARSDAEALCHRDLCATSSRADFDANKSTSESAKSVATVGFVVGGVGLAAGATLFLLSLGSSNEKHASAPRVQPWVGVGSAGVLGRF